MAVRPTMYALIARARLLINDPASTNQAFDDQTIQDVLDATRVNVRYKALQPSPTYAGTTIQYLDYYADVGDWEDDATFWQYRVTQVTPSVNEPIVGHWQFAQTTLPPVFLIGKTYDLYRASADLLERLSARWMLSYNLGVDGQSLQRSQALTMILDVAHTYRLKQRAHVISVSMADFASSEEPVALNLGPQEIDRMGSGDGR